MKNKKLFAMVMSIIMMISLIPTVVFAELPQGVPARLDPPSLEKVEIKYLERPRETEKLAAFQLQVKLPQTALDLDAERPTGGITMIEYFAKADDGEWVTLEGGGYMDDLIGEPTFRVPGKNNTFYATAFAGEYGDLTAIDLNNHTYSFKAQLHYIYYYGEDNQNSDNVYSEFSNTVILGKSSAQAIIADSAKASPWAAPTLKRAAELGLIPAILKNVDMTKPITREEFCELAVSLYEASTKQIAQQASPNPFSDTQNQQILKAYRLGITSGSSANTFSPGAYISREQMAGMLFRTVRVISPSVDYNVPDEKTFRDQDNISSWAVEGIKYLSAQEIFTGYSNGSFLPKQMASREAAVAVILRTYDKMPK